MKELSSNNSTTVMDEEPSLEKTVLVWSDQIKNLNLFSRIKVSLNQEEILYCAFTVKELDTDIVAVNI